MDPRHQDAKGWSGYEPATGAGDRRSQGLVYDHRRRAHSLSFAPLGKLCDVSRPLKLVAFDVGYTLIDARVPLETNTRGVPRLGGRLSGLPVI